jgi:hypothetical protein
MANSNVQCACWDLTLSYDKVKDSTIQDIIDYLKLISKKWVFQREISETSKFDHYQIRLSLIKKKTFKQFKEFIYDTVLEYAHLEPTVNANRKGDKFYSYASKLDTRYQGPWKDSDPPPKLMTRQLKNMLPLQPWQLSLKELILTYNERAIYCVIDQLGNHGKSIFSEWLEYEGIALDVPPFRLFNEIMQCCHGHPPQKAYLIDMPRGLKKGKLTDFYSGVEFLKNGITFDPRYKFSKRRFDRPNIVIFTNTTPNWNLLSLDRWKVFTIDSKNELVQYKQDTEDSPCLIVPPEPPRKRLRRE